MGFVEAVKQDALDPLAGRAGKFRSQPPARSLLELVERLKAKRLGKLVIDLGFLRPLDQRSRGLEFRRLSGQFLVAVVVGERDLQGARFAGANSDQLLLETGDEAVG